MGNLGIAEILVVGAIALLVVGPRRLPELAKALGAAVRAFQEAFTGREKESNEASEPENLPDSQEDKSKS